ncbi:beta-ketoacyl-[acyl-carrier-protein] synthase family protein [Gloeocapsopsis sp. IPPAS B-1203]|uniref:beta-ketoacyl-[acyl-carrier-protein] synthase family protein n=1 Tax=Gloeocapsopsis sp. IPPAS B-1203 TaxID=2049454 RepID=UPI000C17708A|nr:beta-ketoacyl-[acyl-carrier-protein] synthase family protein [Gloeocapsopsis sp. IPPAS B-1203]PIG92436.1 beta-ketoacyl synthase [Gloeocapsopsis sp. IPPAS B-1203]
MSKHDVVITGIGIINPAGTGKDEFWHNISTGKSAIRAISRFDSTDFPTKVAGEIAEFEPADYIPRRFIVKTDRFTHYALAATELALQDAALDLTQEDSYRVGVWFGNNAGGWDICERGFYELYNDGATMVNPWQATAWFPTAAQGYVTIRYGIRGYSKSFVCDRASGASGLYFGIKSIQEGFNDVVIAGGSEAPITRFGMTCYYETGEVSAASDPEKAYLPFDRNRSGLVLGEGSTVLVLESKEHALGRGAKIYGKVVSGCMTTDTDPTSGANFERCMARAIQSAQLQPTDIDIVLAEGCGTQQNDRVEGGAIANVFAQAPNVAVSVPKALYGHLYGASCVTEVACSLLAMETEQLPTMNQTEPDSDCRLNFVTQPQSHPVRHALVNSRAREGVNASFVIGQ